MKFSIALVFASLALIAIVPGVHSSLSDARANRRECGGGGGCGWTVDQKTGAAIDCQTLCGDEGEAESACGISCTQCHDRCCPSSNQCCPKFNRSCY
ncbi:hypothetical protein CF335_g9691 [Tilletia laevis]|nr:hypothetical protein CF335_g9691 [Tilletia laevis]